MDGRELKQYERWKDEVQSLRMENQHLRLELMALRPERHRAAEQQGRDVVETIKTLLKAAWDGKDIALLTDSS